MKKLPLALSVTISLLATSCTKNEIEKPEVKSEIQQDGLNSLSKQIEISQLHATMIETRFGN